MDQSGAELIQGRADERRDLLAMLAQRRLNAQRIAEREPDQGETWVLAQDRARQLAVLIDDVRAGLHEGSAEVAAKLQPKLEQGA